MNEIDANGVDDDMERSAVSARLRGIFKVESSEVVSPIPRKDGIVEPDWNANDIGFFLPSHYFEREDGETFRSLSESPQEWDEATKDMDETIGKMRRNHPEDLSALVDADVSRERRQRAIGVFVADLFEDKGAM